MKETANIKILETEGVGYLELLPGCGWYWGCDQVSNDLYEAKELYESGHRFRKNRLILVRAEDGKIIEPVKPEDGQYFGRPYYTEDGIMLLMVDFPGEVIVIFCCDPEAETKEYARIPLHDAGDCYNLMLHGDPLMLTLQNSSMFRVIWPYKLDIAIEPSESFDFADDGMLYFSKWIEDPDYRETYVIRDMQGKIAGQGDGSIQIMPDGQKWLLV